MSFGRLCRNRGSNGGGVGQGVLEVGGQQITGGVHRGGHDDRGDGEAGEVDGGGFGDLVDRFAVEGQRGHGPIDVTASAGGERVVGEELPDGVDLFGVTEQVGEDLVLQLRPLGACGERFDDDLGGVAEVIGVEGRSGDGPERVGLSGQDLGEAPVVGEKFGIHRS